MGQWSFRDPVTQVLKASGYMESNAPGDIVQAEADDFALTPGQWYYPVDAWEPYTPTPDPDVNGFLLALRELIGLLPVNTLLTAYPVAKLALDLGVWADFTTMVVKAHDPPDLAIDDTLYNAIQTMADTYFIPIALPPL